MLHASCMILGLSLHIYKMGIVSFQQTFVWCSPHARYLCKYFIEATSIFPMLQLREVWNEEGKEFAHNLESVRGRAGAEPGSWLQAAQHHVAMPLSGERSLPMGCDGHSSILGSGQKLPHGSS